MGNTEKKKRIFLFLSCLIIILVLPKISQAALGLTPAKIELNFQPGLEQSFIYKVMEDDPEKRLEIYALGDLAEYVELDKKELIGSGSFTATLKLPASIEKPGKHRILIGVKEEVDKEVAAIGVAIVIQGVIYIDVPYPGKYAEISLKVENVNVGEPVNFKLEITSRGKEDLNIRPRIEIFSEETKIQTLYFQQRVIKSQQNIKLKKSLDTTNYKPGEYTAVAIIDYGEIAKAEAKFKLGTLSVSIVNYTNKIIIGGIRSFEVEIESNWNNKIDNVYASISFIKNSTILSGFKTPSTSLEPWQRTSLDGFFDATNFTEGNYEANITIFYSGKTSGKLVDVEFVKEEEKKKLLLIFSIIALAFILIIAAVFLIRRYLKNVKKK